VNYAIYDEPTGRILQTGTALAIEDAEACAIAFGTDAAALEVPDGTDDRRHYMAAGAPVEFPPQPSPDHTWDWATHTWIDERTLAQAQAQRVAILKDARDALLNGGFTWDGSTFDSDVAVSQPRLLGGAMDAARGAFPDTPWRLADNEWRVLTAADMLAVWGAFTAHMRTCFETFGALEAQVNAAGTIQQVEAITWP